MSNKTSSADRIREKKKLFLAREQKIIDAALELFLKQNIDSVLIPTQVRKPDQPGLDGICFIDDDKVEVCTT